MNKRNKYNALKNIYNRVYCNFIYNNPEWKNPNVHKHRMSKQVMVYSCNERLNSDKSE